MHAAKNLNNPLVVSYNKKGIDPFSVNYNKRVWDPLFIKYKKRGWEQMEDKEEEKQGTRPIAISRVLREQ